MVGEERKSMFNWNETFKDEGSQYFTLLVLKRFAKLHRTAYLKYYRDDFNLLQRMTAYRENHLLFLTYPEIDYTDNLSERAFRKYKRKQKRAVSFRSNSSVEFLCNAMNIIETRRLQGVNIYNTVHEVFLPAASPSASRIN